MVCKRALALLAATAFAACLAFPSVAFAGVAVDDQELSQGDNSVGGGTATLTDTALNMANVVAGTMRADQDLTVNFNGGNTVGVFDIQGSANVTVNFNGENEVEDTHIYDKANVTINANGHNEFEEVEAHGDSNVIIKVTGENDFETIEAHDNASIVVRGTDCQKRDTLDIGEEEAEGGISAENGDVTIDHVTVNLESKTALVGSKSGNVKIDTSKIASEDENENAEIIAGGTMEILESVIEITGTVHSDGKMTINHSDVEAEAPDDKYDAGPYRIYSKTGIELIREKNGEVKKGELDDEEVWYVDTDDGDDVDLEADGEPGYYACKDDSKLPMTGDKSNPWGLSVLALISATTVSLAAKRRRDDEA